MMTYHKKIQLSLEGDKQCGEKVTCLDRTLKEGFLRLHLIRELKIWMKPGLGRMFQEKGTA
jgi:hypothetical protein